MDINLSNLFFYALMRIHSFFLQLLPQLVIKRKRNDYTCMSTTCFGVDKCQKMLSFTLSGSCLTFSPHPYKYATLAGYYFHHITSLYLKSHYLISQVCLHKQLIIYIYFVFVKKSCCLGRLVEILMGKTLLTSQDGKSTRKINPYHPFIILSESFR